MIAYKEYVAFLNSYKPYIYTGMDNLGITKDFRHYVNSTYYYNIDYTLISLANSAIEKDAVKSNWDYIVDNFVKLSTVVNIYTGIIDVEYIIPIDGFCINHSIHWLVKLHSADARIDGAYTIVSSEVINYVREKQTNNTVEAKCTLFGIIDDDLDIKAFAQANNISEDDIVYQIPRRLPIDEIKYVCFNDVDYFILRSKTKYAVIDRPFVNCLYTVINDLDTLKKFQKEKNIRVGINFDLPNNFIANYFTDKKGYNVEENVRSHNYSQLYIWANGTVTKTRPNVPSALSSSGVVNLDNIKTRIVKCANCSDEIEMDSHTYYYDGEWYCEDCASDLEYQRCEHCGYVSDDNLVGLDDEVLCEDCYNDRYFTCDSCGDIFYQDEAYRNADGDYYCHDCYNDYYVECYECGVEIEREDAFFDDYGDAFCEECYHNNFDGKIKNYSYKPYWEKHGESKDNKYFGVEIETDTTDFNESFECFDNNFDIEKYENYVFAKEDGSISGIEIVTHPATLDMWKNDNIYKDLVEALGDAYDYEGRSSGIHIHIDRKAFKNELAIVKLIYIFNKLYYADLFKFSGRRNLQNMERWAYKNNPIRGKKAINYLNRNNDKYTAVNTMHRETVEIRIFQSVLDYDRIMEYLTFCNGLVEATKLAIKDLKDLTVDKILKLGRV